MKKLHDILFINKLVVMAVIGIYKWESQCLQKLVFDLKLGYDFKNAKSYKNIQYYIDYNKVSQMVKQMIYGKRFFLIEDVAEVIAQTLLNNFDIIWICVTVYKPDALKDVCNIGVCIRRMK